MRFEEPKMELIVELLDEVMLKLSPGDGDEDDLFGDDEEF